MTKKQALRRWNRACERWVSRLGFRDYTRHYEIELGELENSNGSANSGAVAAICVTNTRYKWLRATAAFDFVCNADDDDLDETACHEIIHAALDPIDAVTCEVIDSLPRGARAGFEAYRAAALERTTTHLTNVIRSLRS